ncbi:MULTISPECIES: hypothetical protein [unclassified Nonomuraea]|uniref:hypothetical protein n=1 Tax=unclassified Nonomuraea TaxID=2593643 RepID=UPI0033DAA416
MTAVKGMATDSSSRPVRDVAHRLDSDGNGISSAGVTQDSLPGYISLRHHMITLGMQWKVITGPACIGKG